ncbi:hypothetical protein [Achromobacter spanius]|uniref:hypothetical protein n=1 Tax=Achromobacter spanius TaxID=217203 RepID=UPI000F82ADE2|nr:hypothetical protein [Achromobacter spanius]
MGALDFSVENLLPKRDRRGGLIGHGKSSMGYDLETDYQRGGVMDKEFDYQGHRVYVRVREVSGEMPGFTTGLWRANVTVQPEGADWVQVGNGLEFADSVSAYEDGEARGKAFVDGLAPLKVV